MNKDLVSTSAIYDPYLSHSGIKGMKWGVRRYQNEDGSLTLRGAKRYLDGGLSSKKTAISRSQKIAQTSAILANSRTGQKLLESTLGKKYSALNKDSIASGLSLVNSVLAIAKNKQVKEFAKYAWY